MLTEFAFLRHRAAAHAERIGVSLFVHAAYCDCGKADTECGQCGRDDFERPSETLTFHAGVWICADCEEEQTDEHPYPSSPALEGLVDLTSQVRLHAAARAGLIAQRKAGSR